MKRKFLLAVLGAALAQAPAQAAVETYIIDSRHTFPSFEILHFGYSLQRGRFNKTAGKVSLDREARSGMVEVTIETASIDTGLDRLEQVIRSDEFLDTAQHPTIVFKGTAMAFEGEHVKSVTGELTMVGVTRPVTLVASHFKCGSHPMNKKAMCGGEFVASIKRSDWGIKRFIPNLADEMTLRINVEAFRD